MHTDSVAGGSIMLELRSIHKDYFIAKKPLHALVDINLRFNEREFVAILGHPDVGKPRFSI